MIDDPYPENWSRDIEAYLTAQGMPSALVPVVYQLMAAYGWSLPQSAETVCQALKTVQ